MLNGWESIGLGAVPLGLLFFCPLEIIDFLPNPFYILDMKLYSKRQLVFTSILASLFALAFGTILGITCNSNMKAKTLPVQKDDSYAKANDNSGYMHQSAAAASYTQDEYQNISVYEKFNEAVVNITTLEMGYNWFLEPVSTDGASGSGSIIDKRGYVVTNCHVVTNASAINISLADGSSYEGKVIGIDKESDIAVIKFNVPKQVDLKTISFGDSDNLKVGQKVIAIGNPFGLERTLTTGIISGLGRPIQESKNVIIRNMIQTDAAINPGNSGGPLLDSTGKMIGINTMIYSNSGSSSGIGFAIPATTARRVVNDLIKYGKVNRGIINATLIPNSSKFARYAEYEINTGMIVERVSRGSQADKGGLMGGTFSVQYGRFNPQTIYLGGDVIVKIDDINISTIADYYSVLEDKSPGQKVQLTVYRKGRYEKLSIILEGE